MAHVLHLIPPYRIHFPACRYIINDVAVGTGNDGSVIGAFCPSFDFQTAEADIHQLPNMVDHTHVPGVHDVSTLFIFKNREILSRALFFHQVVLIAAGLGTGSPVAVSSGHIVGKEASAAVADTHGPMDESFQLQVGRDFFPDLPDLRKAQFPCQDHPLGPQIIPGTGAYIICNAGLGTDVALTAGRVAPSQGKCPHIRQDQGIHSGLLELLQVGREVDHLVITGHGIHSNMDSDAMAMGKSYRLG